MPIDEFKAERDRARGERAKQLLGNELIAEAFATLEAAYVERWRTTHIDDDKGREKLFVAINVVGKVKEHLQNVIANGSVAAKQLNDLAEEATRKKRFGIV